MFIFLIKLYHKCLIYITSLYTWHTYFMESNNYYLQTAQKLSKLQKNEQCTNISLKNPVVLYPVSSLVVLFLSSILTIFKLKFNNMILLPLKLLAGMIMICMFTILLILICNFFTNTTTWITAVLFFLITSLGAPILIYFGGLVLIAVYVLGISGTTIASLLYYFRDNIDTYINGDKQNEQVPVNSSASSVNSSADNAILQNEINKAFTNNSGSTSEKKITSDMEYYNKDVEELLMEAESAETSNLTAGTLNDSVRIEIKQ